MRRGILIVTATAACSTPGVDVQIEVQHATRVELFVASNWCKNDLGNPCAPAVGWNMNVQAPPPGEIYLLADDNVIEAIAKDGYFDVQLQAEHAYREPIAIAIVGYDDNGTAIEAGMLRGIEIPQHRAETWNVKLEPVDAASEDVTSQPVASMSRARAWQRPPDRNEGWTSCLAYQHWHDSTWVTEYFVPPGDRDCDAQDVECSQYWVDDGNVASTPILCSAGPDVPGTCTLGSQRCAGVGDGTCTSGSICLPKLACASCADRPNGDCLGPVLGNPVIAQNVPRARCEFSTTSNQWCTPTDKIVLPARGSHCTAARIRLPGSPFTGGAIIQSFLYGVTVRVVATADPTGSCEVQVTVSDGATGAYSGFEENVLLAVDYDNGRQIVLPLVLGFEGQSCPTYRPCALLGDDSDPVYACTAP